MQPFDRSILNSRIPLFAKYTQSTTLAYENNGPQLITTFDHPTSFSIDLYKLDPSYRYVVELVVRNLYYPSSKEYMQT